MNIDKPFELLKTAVKIILGVLAGWYLLLAIFVTQEQLYLNGIADIQAEINYSEVLRDHYATIKDRRPLNIEDGEARRDRINANGLDRHYQDLKRKKDQLERWQERKFF